MNKPNIQLTYHANYNGWDMSVNGDYEHQYSHLTDLMCDLTVDSCDDDGSYFYSCVQSGHAISVRNIVESQFGESHIDIEFDTFSS